MDESVSMDEMILTGFHHSSKFKVINIISPQFN